MRFFSQRPPIACVCVPFNTCNTELEILCYNCPKKIILVLRSDLLKTEAVQICFPPPQIKNGTTEKLVINFSWPQGNLLEETFGPLWYQ